tara:strand:- start:127 stop:429 length:303 start_codon:yes stop_codon:yes gene_type:complete
MAKNLIEISIKKKVSGKKPSEYTFSLADSKHVRDILKKAKSLEKKGKSILKSRAKSARKDLNKLAGKVLTKKNVKKAKKKARKGINKAKKSIKKIKKRLK